MLRAISQSQNSLKLLTHRLHPFLSSSLLCFPYSSKGKSEDDSDDVVSLINRDPTSPPRLFVVQPRLRPDSFQQAKLNEALLLANSLEEQRDGYFHTDLFDKGLPPHVVVQNPVIRSPKPRADTYFGPGTVDNIKCHLYNAESKGEIDAVFVNAILSGIQQRNLERAWGKPVLDRVGLIIEIFNAHAFTKEARLQAELAALMYKKTRLVRVRGSDGHLSFGTFGEAEVVSARGRASGGRGFISGAGETELQLQRRRILERRNQLLSQIEEVRRTRALQRASRKRHGGSDGQHLATVAVVGYTNAGKSTLVSALSESDLYSDDRLFATVDPRLRSVVLPSGRKVLLSDTVGFISDLPVQLVDAFHATLEEVVEADLLVHVIDCTAPNLDEHRSTVLQVLEQIGVSQEKIQNMIEVWNKIDCEDEEMSENGFLDQSEDINFCGEDDDEPPVLAENDEDRENESCSMGDQVVSELSPEDVEWTMDSDPEDIYDSWLQAADTQGKENSYKDSSIESKTPEDVQSKPLQDGEIRKDSHSEAPCSPHVKTSAITGVGLQELLELIDDRLKTEDEKLKSERVLERSVFNRKWRPPRTEDAGIAVQG